MAPDDLHSVYRGVLGSHLPNILDSVGSLLSIGVRKFNEVLDVRFHWCYTHTSPAICGFPLLQPSFPPGTLPPTTSEKLSCKFFP
jgi:hypothetical protein